MNFKRITAAVVRAEALICAGLIFTGAAAFASDFTDIESHWAKDTIEELASKGIVNGITETEFQPDGTVTRAEFLKMAMEANGIETVPWRYSECLEVDDTDWFAPYVQSALDKGIIPDDMITGFSVSVETDEEGNAKVKYGGAFNGNLPITREEMAVISQYTYQYTRNANTMKKMAESAELDFEDVDEISGWAFETVKLACAQGFITGMDNGKLEPQATATRAQAAVIIDRLLDASDN